nr:MAG TPA: hypothetical protein [Caudoviricetes sp.]
MRYDSEPSGDECGNLRHVIRPSASSTLHEPS